MKSIIVFFILLICSTINPIQSQSEEYFECISPEKESISPSDCIDVKIPEKDGFSCCAMRVTLGQNISYNCFALENKFIQNATLFDLYVASQKNYQFLFDNLGGDIEIICQNNLTKSENFEKLSDEYFSCNNYHLNGVDNETSCLQIDIPTKDGSKCCYLESYQFNTEGKVIKDKRCYLIPNEYFSKNKTLNNYLIDATNLKNLDNIFNTNVTIKCNDYEAFNYNSKILINGTIIPVNDNPTQTIITEKIITENIKTDEINNTDFSTGESDILRGREKSSDSGVKSWVIILIIIGSLIIIGAIIISVVYCNKRKLKTISENKNESQNNIHN